VREIEFRAYLSEDQFKRLRQNKPSAGLVCAVLSLTLAWVFSAFSLGPSKLEFGELSLGSGSSLPVKLTNRGLTEFHAASIGVEGKDSADFQVNEQPCATVAPGESCVVWVKFRPSEPGIKTARLVVRTKDGSEFSSNFTGTATKDKSVPPLVSTQTTVAPQSPIPTPPPASPTANSVAPPASRPPPPARPSPPTPNVSEPSPPALPPIAPSPPTFLPPYRPASGVTPEPTRLPKIQIQPRAMDFSRSRRGALTVANPGTGPLHVRFNLGGTDRANFEYAPSVCGPILEGQQCTVTISYKPGIDVQERALIAWLKVSHNASNAANPQTVNLMWTPVRPHGRPHVTVTPETLQFNSPAPSTEFLAPLTQRVTVRSDGTVGLRQLNLQPSFGGAPFSYLTNCPTTLGPGQNCAVQVKFAPTDSRRYNGKLNVFEGGTQLASVDLQASGASQHPAKEPAGNATGGRNWLPPGSGTLDGPLQPKSPSPGTGTADGPVQPKSPHPGGKGRWGRGLALPANRATDNIPRAPTPPAPKRNAPSKIPQRPATTVPPPLTPVK